MFGINDSILKEYLQSIDEEKALSIERVLPLYKYGFILKEEHFKDLTIHSGFRNTVQRYIDDKKSITKAELISILKYYSLDYEPIQDPEFPDLLRIVYIPPAQVELVGTIIVVPILSYIPTAAIQIDLSALSTTVTYVPTAQIAWETGILITYVPEASISIDTEALISNITYVPTAQVSMEALSPALTYIPESQIFFEAPPVPPTVTYVPTTQILIGEDISSIILSYIPEAQIKFDTAEVSTGNYYFGYRDRTDNGVRITLTDVKNLLQANESEVLAMIAGTSSIGKIQTGEITEETGTAELDAENWNEGNTATTQAWYFFLTPASNPSGNIAIRTAVQTPMGMIIVGPNSVDGFTSDSSIAEINGVNYSLHITRGPTVFVSGLHKLLE